MVLAADDGFITWTLGTELQPGKLVRADPYFFPEDPSFRKIIAARAEIVYRIRNETMSSKAQAAVERRVNAVLDPSLRANPHIIATLIDHQNERERELVQDE